MHFERLVLQIPPDAYRCHYVKAHVTVQRRINGTLGVVHGQRTLARFDAQGHAVKHKLKRAA